MTKYISLESKEIKKTILTTCLCGSGWIILPIEPEKFDKIVYLGKCGFDGDMFACYRKDNTIHIYKGIKGDEF